MQPPAIPKQKGVPTPVYVSLNAYAHVCMHRMKFSNYKGITGITWGGRVIPRLEIMDGQPPTSYQSQAIRLLQGIGAIDGICCLAASCPSKTPPNHTAYINTQTNSQLSLVHVFILTCFPKNS